MVLEQYLGSPTVGAFAGRWPHIIRKHKQNVRTTYFHSVPLPEGIPDSILPAFRGNGTGLPKER
jgi:hypothetical protein